MAVIETKYSVNDVVYCADTTTTRKQHPCPDCLGERKWKAMSPAGSEYHFGCPRCSTRFHSDQDLCLDYTATVPLVSRLTIGSVRTDSHRGAWGDDDPHTYMCNETGVGGGRIYRERDLFRTQEEAQEAAEVRAALADKNTEWIVKLYDKTLEVSDYQLEHAMMREAKEYRSQIGSLFWNVSDLFEAIEAADDKDAILEALDDYKSFTWERDKERFAAQGIEAQSDETPTAAQPEGQEPAPAGDAPND